MKAEALSVKKKAEGQIILCNPKKTESEPIAVAARANTKSREIAAANANTAGQQPQDQQMKNPPKRSSLMKRAVAVVVAAVGLIAPKRRKGP
jgi:hypothetical protein